MGIGQYVTRKFRDGTTYGNDERELFISGMIGANILLLPMIYPHIEVHVKRFIRAFEKNVFYKDVNFEDTVTGKNPAMMQASIRLGLYIHI